MAIRTPIDVAWVPTTARTLLRNAIVRFVRRLADRLGFDMVYRNYYSPIPQTAELPLKTWSEPASMCGVDLSPDDQLEYLEELSPFLIEFRDQVCPDASTNGGFHLDNRSFGPVDADVLFATIRRHKPRKIIELGSGYSTLVSASACSANEREGHRTEFSAFDPYPQEFLLHEIEGLSEIRAIPVSALPTADLVALESGDVLFIDTTHTVKVGSEVNDLIFEVLPRLKPGVLVHFHDIFLPWEYPREWIEERAYYWAEQYLVHAFLMHNDQYEVLLAAHDLVRRSGEGLTNLLDTSGVEMHAPSSLWLRRAAD